jgi:uncharacterized protein (DUF1778 family)
MRNRTATKESKIQLRLLEAQKSIISVAAKLKQTTLSHFMVEHAFNAAQQVIADQVAFSLSPEKWAAFHEALERPPRDIPALRKLLTEPSVFEAEDRDIASTGAIRQESQNLDV